MQQQYLRNKAEYMLNADDFWYADPTKQQYGREVYKRKYSQIYSQGFRRKRA